MLKFLQTLRNNWKKSAFGAAALSYGVSYSKEIYDTELLMRQYCENAVKYGDEPCPTNVKPRHVTVILNAAARKRKAKVLFENYCEPLLHLAGIAVTILQTESVNDTRSLVENLNSPTDAIIVAGGDGTLSDVITGLMRKYQNNLNSVKHCPIGILPLGQMNMVANSLNHKEYNSLPDIHRMTDATMAIIDGAYKLIDVIEIKPLENEPNNKEKKAVYAAGGVEWGAWQDAQIRKNKYWYWGSLKKYMTYVFNGYKRDLNWNCDAIIRYTEPCAGCSSCYQRTTSFDQLAPSDRRWWHAFVPKKRIFSSEPDVDYSKITNDKCEILHEIPIKTTDFSVKTSNIDNFKTQPNPSLKMQLGPKDVDYMTFVSEGWRRETGSKTLVEHTVEAKDIELYPNQPDNQQLFYIDNEEFELTPVKIKLLPQCIKIFCSKNEFNTLNR